MRHEANIVVKNEIEMVVGVCEGGRKTFFFFFLHFLSGIYRNVGNIFLYGTLVYFYV
jgi:hypothetical protein